MPNGPKTLQAAIAYFSDPEKCFQYAVKLRWPEGGITCPRCGEVKHSFIKTRRIWFCYVCKKQFTVKVKTIMEDSALGLDKWMTAVWMLVACKNGISSHELARSLGITQKSAWFMLHRIREAMAGDKSYKFGGSDGSPIESDETFIGPMPQKMHRSRRLKMRAGRGQGKRFGYVSKTAVFGILDRGLRQVRANVVPNVKRETLQNAILDNVEHGSTVYTDAGVGFDNLHKNFVHEVVNHAETYVRGQVHTNGIENFWALLKRTLRGTYVAVEPFHLDRYLGEQVFRFNNRATKDNPLNDADRFTLAMSQVAGHRLTYSELTGKDQSPRYETTRTGTQEPF
ncbi:MAG TPA: IS1595 family transposase [Candidatus Dormibacteraeota bacterium]|nr:IS1595 family transposase [Candidatus Dormibacteraeota bacterium]